MSSLNFYTNIYLLLILRPTFSEKPDLNFLNPRVT